MTTTRSLHDRLGGNQLDLDAFTDDLFDRITRDPLLRPWFARMLATPARMDAHKKGFAKFLLKALRGEPWTGRSLREAHKHLSLDGRKPGDDEFNAVGGHLADTMAAWNATEDVINDVLGWADAERDEVLNR